MKRNNENMKLSKKKRNNSKRSYTDMLLSKLSSTDIELQIKYDRLRNEGKLVSTVYTPTV
jgi:hypothetical protein